MKQARLLRGAAPTNRLAAAPRGTTPVEDGGGISRGGAAGRPIAVSGRADESLATFDRAVVDYLERHEAVPGAALAVARRGRLVYARGFGLADREANQPVEPGSRFRIASLSKPITAAAILRLVQENRLSLEARVVECLDLEAQAADAARLDPRWRRITVDHLLHHTAGFDRDASFDPMFRSIEIAREQGCAPPAMPGAIIRSMLGRPLDFDPGEREAYSNFGYCLLGRVIERVTGQAYEAAVRSLVLKPLRLGGMRLGATRRGERADREVAYDAGSDRVRSVFDEKGPEVALPYGGWCLEAMDAHGGWIASAPDLVRFGSAFDLDAEEPLLSGHARDLVFAPPPGAAGHEVDGGPRGRYYAHGWSIVRVGPERINTFHTGSLDGTSTILVRRHDGLCWALLFNSRAGDPTGPMDGALHEAADAVRTWPEIDQSWRYLEAID